MIAWTWLHRSHRVIPRSDRYNSFDADKIDKIYSAARESMQIRIYGNRHDGSKVLNGAVTVQLDDDPE